MNQAKEKNSFILRKKKTSLSLNLKLTKMKKLLFPMLAIFLIMACKKEVSTKKGAEEFVIATEKVQENKIQVCHKTGSGTSHTITISKSAWPAHQAHGDVLGDCSVPSVTICDQVWMIKNLDVSTYRNGDPIPQVTNPTEWDNLTTGAWCYYKNDPAFGKVYGKIYNGYAVTDPRGLAPEGWHVPNNAEWIELVDCLGGTSVAGGALKSTGTIGLDPNGLIDELAGLWASPNTGATNSSGFTGLPGGDNFGSNGFNRAGFYGTWWSSTENGTNNAYIISLAYKFANVDIMPPAFSTVKQFGCSVRCVKD